MYADDIRIELDAGRLPPLSRLPPDGWVELTSACLSSQFTVDQRVRIATACSGVAEAVPTLSVLCADAGVPYAIGAAFLSAQSVATFRRYAAPAGLLPYVNGAPLDARAAAALGQFLARPEVWLWALGNVLSTAVARQLPELVLDRDLPVRLAAAKALVTISNESSSELLFTLLSDGDAVVRAVAEAELSRRWGPAELATRLQAQADEYAQLGERARAAQAGLDGMLDKIPGLRVVLSTLGGGATAAGTAVMGVGRGAAAVVGGAWSATRNAFRSKDDEAGQIALALAISWADGQLMPAERTALLQLIRGSACSDEDSTILIGALVSQPQPGLLVPFIRRLKHPGAAASQARERLGASTLEPTNYLVEVATSAGVSIHDIVGSSK